MFDRKHTDTKIILAKVLFDKYILFSSINTLTVILTSEHHFAMFLCWVGSPSSPHIAPVLQQLQWPAVHFHAVLQFSPPNPFLVFLPRNSQNSYPASSALRSTSAYLSSSLLLLLLCQIFFTLALESPPQDIWNLTSLPTFESHLKIHPFRPAFPSETVSIKCIFYYVYWNF